MTVELRDRSSQKQFLRFHLLPSTTVMLPVEQLTEVLKIPLGQITPIPEMPPWVMGVYNWRGEVLWIIDLGYLVGLTPAHQQRSSTSIYRAVVLHGSGVNARLARNQMLGLVVSQVEDIEWCSTEAIQSPPASLVTPTLSPFLRGYWLKNNSEVIVALDGDAILAAMPKP